MFPTSTDLSSVMSDMVRGALVSWLDRAHASKSYRPYDLIVADDGDLDRQEHFHISELGVTHILAGRWSDHVPLDVWDRESKQFDRLCQLGFFRNFVLGRSLQKWRKVSLPLALWVSEDADIQQLFVHAWRAPLAFGQLIDLSLWRQSAGNSKTEV